MNRKEVISYIHNFVKTATVEQLRNLVCSTFSPTCSNDCPLRSKDSYECKPIIDIEEKDD